MDSLPVDRGIRASVEAPVDPPETIIRVLLDDLAYPLRQKLVELVAPIKAIRLTINTRLGDLEHPAKPPDRGLFTHLLLVLVPGFQSGISSSS